MMENRNTFRHWFGTDPLAPFLVAILAIEIFFYFGIPALWYFGLLPKS